MFRPVRRQPQRGKQPSREVQLMTHTRPSPDDAATTPAGAAQNVPHEPQTRPWNHGQTPHLPQSPQTLFQFQGRLRRLSNTRHEAAGKRRSDVETLRSITTERRHCKHCFRNLSDSEAARSAGAGVPLARGHLTILSGCPGQYLGAAPIRGHRESSVRRFFVARARALRVTSPPPSRRVGCTGQGSLAEGSVTPADRSSHSQSPTPPTPPSRRPPGASTVRPIGPGIGPGGPHHGLSA